LQYAKTIIREWVNPFLSELLQSGAWFAPNCSIQADLIFCLSGFFE
jgi:hypothetical protein